MSVTRRLARFIVESAPSDVPERVRHEGTRSFVNWLGCALGGIHHDASKKALAARALTAGPPQATLVARPGATDIYTAAFINAIGAHVFDFDDAQPRSTNINPSCSVAPVPLALGEYLKGSGKDVLHAFILGLDAECRIANAVYLDNNRRWFTNSTAGVFGAVAAAGKLLRLSEQQMTWAFGIAATQASGLRDMFGTMCKSFNVARAAECGMLAAVLAREDFDSSECVIEAPLGFAQTFMPGSDPAPVAARLGDEYEVSYNIYKPFACGIVLHAAIDACIQVRKEYRFELDAIEKVSLQVHPIVIQITNLRDAQTGLQGKFSVYHCAALALIYGAAGERQFSDENARDPAVLALRNRIEASPEPNFKRSQARVLVQLKDGRSYEKKIEAAIGSLDNPLSDEQISDKFRTLAEGILAPDATSHLIELCWRLESLPDFSIIPLATRAAHNAHA